MSKILLAFLLTLCMGALSQNYVLLTQGTTLSEQSSGTFQYTVQGTTPAYGMLKVQIIGAQALTANISRCKPGNPALDSVVCAPVLGGNCTRTLTVTPCEFYPSATYFVFVQSNSTFSILVTETVIPVATVSTDALISATLPSEGIHLYKFTVASATQFVTVSVYVDSPNNTGTIRSGLSSSPIVSCVNLVEAVQASCGFPGAGTGLNQICQLQANPDCTKTTSTTYYVLVKGDAGDKYKMDFLVGAPVMELTPGQMYTLSTIKPSFFKYTKLSNDTQDQTISISPSANLFWTEFTNLVPSSCNSGPASGSFLLSACFGPGDYIFQVTPTTLTPNNNNTQANFTLNVSPQAAPYSDANYSEWYVQTGETTVIRRFPNPGYPLGKALSVELKDTSFVGVNIYFGREGPATTPVCINQDIKCDTKTTGTCLVTVPMCAISRTTGDLFAAFVGNGGSRAITFRINVTDPTELQIGAPLATTVTNGLTNVHFYQLNGTEPQSISITSGSSLEFSIVDDSKANCPAYQAAGTSYTLFCLPDGVTRTAIFVKSTNQGQVVPYTLTASGTVVGHSFPLTVNQPNTVTADTANYYFQIDNSAAQSLIIEIATGIASVTAKVYQGCKLIIPDSACAASTTCYLRLTEASQLTNSTYWVIVKANAAGSNLTLRYTSGVANCQQLNTSILPFCGTYLSTTPSSYIVANAAASDSAASTSYQANRPYFVSGTAQCDASLKAFVCDTAFRKCSGSGSVTPLCGVCPSLKEQCGQVFCTGELCSQVEDPQCNLNPSTTPTPTPTSGKGSGGSSTSTSTSFAERSATVGTILALSVLLMACLTL